MWVTFPVSADPYSVTMSDGTPSSLPLAASPAAGTDLAPSSSVGPVATGAAGGPSPYPEPPISRFWAKLDSPFGAGFLLTLGGLGALAIGAAFINLSTIFIYIAFALFAALGLDPVSSSSSGTTSSAAWPC